MKEIEHKVEYRPIKDLRELPGNPRTISKSQFEKLKKSIADNADYFEARPLILSNRTGELVILAGNQRYKASKALGLTEVPTVLLENLTEEREREIIIRDNVENGEWDFDELANAWDPVELEEWGVAVPDINPSDKASLDLQETFIIPPFTVLDSRQGYWQDRKRAWMTIIGDKGETREGTLYKDINSKSWVSRQLARNMHGGGVSILDPCLSEIALKWFLPAGTKNNNTFDPFAGDTVFGFVSAYCGNNFIGTELRQEQADENNRRVKGMSAKYYCDDGQNIGKYVKPETQDLLFSCPPYFDLEQYSDDPRDASNQSYEGFMQIIDNAFTAGIKALKPNRFAVIVMSNVRNKTDGAYYDICGDITRVFQREGMTLYNELVLVNCLAGGSLRAERNMRNRKMTRCHQEVLVYHKGLPQIEPAHQEIKVYYKGDPKKIQSEMGDIPTIGLTDEFEEKPEVNL